MIHENMVLKYTDGTDQRIRVIYVDNENSEYAYVGIDDILAVPKFNKLIKLDSEVENGLLVKIPDPFFKNIFEDELSDSDKSKREMNWVLINNAWKKSKSELLNKRTRNAVFENISKKSDIPVITIKRLFSRFWQRGMNKNSLLPDYRNSGGKGKSRNLSEKKVGRPKNSDINGDITIGINITDDVKKLFEIGINKYYRKSNKLSITETYREILRDFFSDVFIENGEKKHIIWDDSRIPSYDQFYYWFKKFEDPRKDIISREGSKEFDLKHRELLSNSTIETDGPGTRFQIDATVADIYLVSALDHNKIIGRPIVYAVIDVFSRLVIGIYVGLEGPSWIGAMMTLDNMVADKVEFCKHYGINITEDQWPSGYIPDIIEADRGEFESYSTNNLVNNLNIDVENDPPYRGDLKGIVERNFRTTNEKIKHRTPGAIQKEFRKRGDRDYRLDATLTLKMFTKIYINIVLQHNNKIIEKYPMSKEMIRDNIVPKPIDLWNWGIENKKGRLRVVDREIMRLNILPTRKVNISRAGIRFEGMYYSSPKAIEEQWFIKTKKSSINIVYDPRNINEIYILHGDGKTYDTCYLLEPSQQYRDYFLEEVIFNNELVSELKKLHKKQQNQLDIDVNKEIEKIVKEAEKLKNSSINIESDSKRLKGIRDNRALEKEINRNNEVFILGEGKKNPTKQAEVLELIQDNDKSNDTQESDNNRIMNMLRKKRDEKREK